MKKLALIMAFGLGIVSNINSITVQDLANMSNAELKKTFGYRYPDWKNSGVPAFAAYGDQYDYSKISEYPLISYANISEDSANKESTLVVKLKHVRRELSELAGKYTFYNIPKMGSLEYMLEYGANAEYHPDNIESKLYIEVGTGSNITHYSYSNGKITLFGVAKSSPAVANYDIKFQAQLKQDGTLDTNFGNKGILITQGQLPKPTVKL